MGDNLVDYTLQTMEKDGPEKDFEERMSMLREELAEAQLNDDAILAANLEAQIFQTEASLEEFRKNASAIDLEFAERLAKLEARADVVKEKREQSLKHSARQMKANGQDAKGLGVGLTIAYSFIGCPIVGYLIGLGIEKGGGPPFSKDWGAVIGILIGFFAMIILVNRESGNR
jgi:F0F1-type ATP synthase assembly protein I